MLLGCLIGTFKIDIFIMFRGHLKLFCVVCFCLTARTKSGEVFHDRAKQVTNPHLPFRSPERLLDEDHN